MKQWRRIKGVFSSASLADPGWVSKTVVVFLINGLIMMACRETQKADLIIHNAKIYMVNENFDMAEAMVISQGKIVAIGPEHEIMNKYVATDVLDLKRKVVFPSWIDSHAHFYGLALSMRECPLYGAASVEEVVERLQKFRQQHPDEAWLLGRGWDQNLWAGKKFPDRRILDSLFPDLPVCLTRVDGHAVWANSRALEVGGFQSSKAIPGGKILQRPDGSLSGILLDNAAEQLKQCIPLPSRNQMVQYLKQSQKICFSYGISCVHDAGLNKEQIQLIDSLQKEGSLSIRIYAMINASPENMSYYLERGPYETPQLKVRSFKYYADGALGSRGALLKQKYADDDTYGLCLADLDSLDALLKKVYERNFQMNTHCIGDSAVKIMLEAYGRCLGTINDRRWRIEHAQVVDPDDMSLFSRYTIIPSVQPTHAISDKLWAGDRLGAERIRHAYAYRRLLSANGILPLGTDFPIEEPDPLKTYFAAVYRENYDLSDKKVFLPEEKLTREEALRGMTIWGSMAAFWENEIGSLEVGKQADFVVYDHDFTLLPKEDFFTVKVIYLYISGKRVYPE